MKGIGMEIERGKGIHWGERFDAYEMQFFSDIPGRSFTRQTLESVARSFVDRKGNETIEKHGAFRPLMVGNSYSSQRWFNRHVRAIKESAGQIERRRRKKNERWLVTIDYELAVSTNGINVLDSSPYPLKLHLPFGILDREQKRFLLSAVDFFDYIVPKILPCTF